MKTRSILPLVTLLCLGFTSKATSEIVDVKVIDSGGSGSYKAIAAQEASLHDYVVYRPEDLAKASEKEGPLPLLVFANGGCKDSSITHERLLSDVASHGYVIIAIGSLAKEPKPELHDTDSEMMIGAIDWMESQCADTQSEYFNQVNLSRIVAMGQSCGGAQVLYAAKDPRFKRYMMFNSGIGNMTMAGADRKSLENLKGEIIYLIGGPSDIAYENAELDYKRIEDVPVTVANFDSSHVGTFEEQYGGTFSDLTIEWLDWQLKAKKEKAAIFLDPPSARYAQWSIKSKNFPEKSDPVMTQYGQVQGLKTADGLTIFKGIPFAAPPVGDLRWKAPQPHESWQGILETTDYGPNPYQGNGSGNVSEDCLYLNIWSPAKSADEKIPVLVWIYGGGFSFGGTADPNTTGTFLAQKGVVMVSLNYRVGSLGFLAHPELSQESPHHASGNYGLKDQIAGLKWIKNNIAAFGGDPEKVTIFGESAGGISVSMLCASPEAKGLFSGAISQSGGSFGPTRPTTYPGENMKTLQMAEAEGLAYQTQTGAKNLEELRTLPPEKLPSGWGMGSSWPIVDGWIIPDDQFKLYESGQYNDVDVLVGYNSDEGLSFSRERTPEEFIQNVEKRYGPWADKLLEAYPVGETTVPKTARDLMRDAAFGWQTWSWARLQAETGDCNVYLYYFDQEPNLKNAPPGEVGSPHGMEVRYVFQTLDRIDKSIDENDWEISDLMSTYWTNFAKYGDPNGPSVPEWPLFEPDQPDANTMYFDETAFPGPVPDVKALKVLDGYFEWRRTPEGHAWAK